MALVKALKISAIGCLFVLGMPIPAHAGGYDDGRIYCDDSGYRCYRARRDDDDSYWNRDDWRGDRDGDYRDRDWDWGRHEVCDSDGDRCYSTSGRYWNYREYYRRHGYRWND